jgi:DMSO/TMAO reductase YedYZ molybdopterin-dependent catalytic subunit
MKKMTRRSLLTGGVAAVGAAIVGSTAAVGRQRGIVPPDSGGVYGVGETLNYATHRLLGRDSLAREFARDMISAKPFANEIAPPTALFQRHQAEEFANWRVAIQGSVARPIQLSLDELRAMPSRSQITEIACEEGWSYVAEWTGTPLSEALRAAQPRASARYVVYYSSDPNWWESIDIDEALHPQTLLTLGMNGGNLPVPFGGPVRMRVPRQLGYKSIKFVERILVVDSLEGISLGSGDYAWYAGI